MKHHNQSSIRHKLFMEHMKSMYVNSIYWLQAASDTCDNSILEARRTHAMIRGYNAIDLHIKRIAPRSILPINMLYRRDTPMYVSDFCIRHVPETMRSLCENYKYRGGVRPLRYNAINVSGVPTLSVRQLCGVDRLSTGLYGKTGGL